jgi:hypothetical protein
MKLKVLEYEKKFDYHACVDQDTGKIYRIDLLVDGDIEGYKDNPYSSLIGRTVEVENLIPFLYLGVKVRVVKKGGRKRERVS